MEPFALALDLVTGRLAPHTSRTVRRISEMSGMYADADAHEQLAGTGDPVVYEVLQYDVPFDNGQLVCCTTVIYAGLVGEEYFMTKGHFHEKRSTGEVYLGISGHGYLLMFVDGRTAELEMGPGTLAYVPPYWAHRTLNVGDEPFSFLAVYPGDAGHDYRTIERTGFPRRVIRAASGPIVVSAFGETPRSIG
ncbi:MAG TPA: glucose-6-phosphate isomerase family protein [Candidatus Baltobacterales bacterium]|nr:glucose-6-phosphate isomerase family protein [Candidatus Baltobacterales bacterium]